jgi:hypothetical protein
MELSEAELVTVFDLLDNAWEKRPLTEAESELYRRIIKEAVKR